MENCKNTIKAKSWKRRGHMDKTVIKKREWSLADGAFPLEIVHIGECANNMTMFHWHEYMEISFIQKGKGVYEIEDKVFEVNRGDIILINNIEKHRVTFSPEEPLFETVIHFDPALIWSSGRSTLDSNYLRLFKYELASFNNRPELDEHAKDTMSSIISDIIDEYKCRREYYELMIKSKLLTLITLLLRECRVRSVDRYDALSKRNQIGRLSRIISFIDDNFDKDINMESTANKFFMNTSYFSNYFKKNVGVNFLEYLTRVRVEKALKLMDDTDINSTDAAFACGFNNVTSFYNAFRRITGMNPGSYKRNARKHETLQH